MEKENARYQTLEQLHERRKQVIRLHKKGIKVMQIGFCRVSRVWPNKGVSLATFSSSEAVDVYLLSGRPH